MLPKSTTTDTRATLKLEGVLLAGSRGFLLLLLLCQLSVLGRSMLCHQVTEILLLQGVRNTLHLGIVFGLQRRLIHTAALATGLKLTWVKGYGHSLFQSTNVIPMLRPHESGNLRLNRKTPMRFSNFELQPFFTSFCGITV